MVGTVAAIDFEDVDAAPRRAGHVAAAGFGVASVVALVAALRLSLDVVVFGLLVFGVAHLGFEVRYITGRYRPMLQGRVLVGVSVALLAIVAGRLVANGAWWTRTEIVILAGALVWVLLVHVHDARRRGIGLAAVAVAATIALWFTPAWFVAQAWLHNVIPVVFLWQWSSVLADHRGRQLFRGVTIGWVAVVPLAILAGAFDPLLRAGTATAGQIAQAGGVTATVVPPAWQGDLWAARLLAAFAFLQLLHYTVWLWHFPRADRAATRTFEETAVGHALRSWRLPALMLGVSAVLALVAWFDYRSGRGMYTSMAAFHAYLEYPVLLALAIGAPSVRRAVDAPAAT
jgi:hypothetical protein